jgi:hypothetical protein
MKKKNNLSVLALLLFLIVTKVFAQSPIPTNNCKDYTITITEELRNTILSGIAQKLTSEISFDSNNVYIFSLIKFDTLQIENDKIFFNSLLEYLRIHKPKNIKFVFIATEIPRQSLRQDLIGNILRVQCNPSSNEILLLANKKFKKKYAKDNFAVIKN